MDFNTFIPMLILASIAIITLWQMKSGNGYALASRVVDSMLAENQALRQKSKSCDDERKRLDRLLTEREKEVEYLRRLLEKGQGISITGTEVLVDGDVVGRDKKEES